MEKRRYCSLPLLPTGTLSTDTSESDTGTGRLTTPDGFHFRHLKDNARDFSSLSQVFSYLWDSYWFPFISLQYENQLRKKKNLSAFMSQHYFTCVVMQR